MTWLEYYTMNPADQIDLLLTAAHDEGHHFFTGKYPTRHTKPVNEARTAYMKKASELLSRHPA